MTQKFRKRVFAIMMSITMTLTVAGGAVSTFAAVSGNQTVRTGLNMRSAMTTRGDNVILVIPSGGTVSIVSAESNNWYKITYNGKTGYVKGGYFGTPEKKSASGSSSTKVMAENLNMRSAMDKSTPDNIITVIGKGKTVTILNQESNGWYKVKYKGNTGYIKGGHFTDDTSRVGAKDAEPSYGNLTTTGDVNLRDAASSKTGKVITVIPANKSIKNLTREGNWYKVQYNGSTGYVYKNYVK